MKSLQRTNIAPHIHVFDNEVSDTMNTHIQDHYKLELECVLPGVRDFIVEYMYMWCNVGAL